MVEININLIQNNHIINYSVYDYDNINSYYIELNYGINLYLRLLKKYDLSCYCKFLHNCYKANNTTNLIKCLLNNKSAKALSYLIWLRENNLKYENKNTKNYQYYSPLGNIANLLRYGFDWDNTIENFQYWKNLCIKMKEIYLKAIGQI